MDPSRKFLVLLTRYRSGGAGKVVTVAREPNPALGPPSFSCWGHVPSALQEMKKESGSSGCGNIFAF
ncbi:hypothetical protein P8C59_005912 [Phyllachora maydis]|uniref:Uncharacterized protein n=1 Tax=Phyllachora maydis TaxID=1825666 RepID=A0AAD9ME00_9PEZI|nr:hypothetical protein P8C59_005912 [Phyllachora maydis]